MEWVKVPYESIRKPGNPDFVPDSAGGLGGGIGSHAGHRMAYDARTVSYTHLRAGEADEEAICDALYVAAGFGQVIAARATLAGAEGGCQAEVGAASAMAAAALCHLKGGTPEQCAAAAAMALGNLLGLVCDPVAGLVEVPCIKRNVVGAVNAVSCANMALAGVDYAIPCDEVIDAMGRVGSLLSPDLRETGQGGLAATPTGVRIAERLAEEA